jgi:tetratricopeptide (TPR) repeat protein
VPGAGGRNLFKEECADEILSAPSLRGDLKLIYNKYRQIPVLLLLIFWIAVSGCAVFTPPQEDTPTIRIEEQLSPPKQAEPREIASLQLTKQGRMLLENGKVDEAITVLEQALNIHPTNGRNYYYLSEAWIMKNNILQAKEWNRQAEMYLSDDTYWLKKVLDQKERIRKLLK